LACAPPVLRAKRRKWRPKGERGTPPLRRGFNGDLIKIQLNFDYNMVK
jgi:hypothetical protein